MVQTTDRPTTNRKRPVTPADLEWYKSAQRPLAEIIADLSKPIPQQYLSQRKQGGAQLTFLPWYQCANLLDRVCGGQWEKRIVHIFEGKERLYMTVEITIHAQEGSFSRTGSGSENLKETFWNPETQRYEIRDWAYGDVLSKVESTAFRRAAAAWGLARYLYDKD